MRLASSIAFLLLWGLAALFLHTRWQEQQGQRLNENTHVLQTTYHASISMYRLATETFIKQVVQRPEVIETFATGLAKSHSARNVARGKLYRLLSPAFSDLKQLGIEQLQFQSANGLSFLRFHAPAKYDDALAEVRPSIRISNAENRAVHGFEIGRLNLGFRYIFPLHHENRHLGSVETGVTFRSLSEAMTEIKPGREFHLLLKREAIEESLFEELRVLYVESPVHDEFVIEDPLLEFPSSRPHPSAASSEIDRLLKQNPRVHELMHSGLPFSEAVSIPGGDWAVSFIPVEDIEGKNVAYVISYALSPSLTSLRHAFLTVLAIASLALAGFYWLTLKLLRNHSTMKQEKQHLQTIMDTIADGLYVMDRKGRIVQSNPAFSEILGFPPEEFLGQVSHHLFHVHGDGSDIPVSECPIISATSRGIDYSGEECFRHRDGRLLTVELTCKPIMLKGRITGSVTAFRDISARKAAQEKLLENDRIKSEFIATASHELRTPLAVIQGYTELLQESNGFTSEEVQDMEAIIYQKALALERIVDDLLDVSRIESGRPICLELSHVEICHDIRQLVRDFEKEVASHRFSTDLPETDTILNIDKFKTHQVLENLLNNAVKFSPPGSDIHVSGKIYGQHFQVCVSDQGEGISPENHQNIFDKFYRVDSSDTAKAGFGLGLYLVKRIIEAHLGSIRIESLLGQGTSVIFTLPLSTPDVADPP